MLAVVSPDISEILLGIPWLTIYDLTTHWATRDYIFNLRKVSVEIASAEEFKKISREDQSKVFIIGAIDIEKIITGEELLEWYHEFASIFSEAESQELPPHHEGVDLKIKLEESKSPPFGPIYHYSPQESAVIREYMQIMLAKGWIRVSKSSAGAPLLCAAKKDGGIRVCVDFRGLNTISPKNHYPLPLINETISRLSGAKIFT